jgi:acylphosphatase
MHIGHITVELQITGRVQGVGYRDSMRAAARGFGVAGWVRNRADGSVQAMVQGPEAQVEALVAWCREGPPPARVQDVQARRIDDAEALGDFVCRATH